MLAIVQPALVVYWFVSGLVFGVAYLQAIKCMGSDVSLHEIILNIFKLISYIKWCNDCKMFPCTLEWFVFKKKSATLKNL